MTTELNEAFTDAPPEGLAPWSMKTKALIKRACLKAGAGFDDPQLYGAYVHISRGEYEPTAEQIWETFIGLSDAFSDEMERYINRVTEREEAAAVTTEDGEGKP